LKIPLSDRPLQAIERVRNIPGQYKTAKEELHQRYESKEKSDFCSFTVEANYYAGRLLQKPT